ncbi:type I methionyl aminopeptidase [Candidatus Saccharibacteria bacterium]|nr:type I methionyl aminopeptidase [Candidatus Saccharibacteria bacterium]
MRAGGRILASVLDQVSRAAAPGMSTKDLANMAAKELKALGARPAFLHHQDFPDVLCTSLNQELVHGIPSSKKIIKKGDLLSLDLGVIYKGLITDGATTIYIGSQPSSDIKRLLAGSQRALSAGIEAVRGDGTRVGDISAAIQTTLERYKLGIIRDLVGHGVGDKIHEEPNIPNYGVRGNGSVLHGGVTIAIEPMASLGGWQVQTAKDKWTVLMSDGSLVAHFEHTVLVTEKSAEILTQI